MPRRWSQETGVADALLGLGTVLAPLVVALFDGLGFWWAREEPAAASAIVAGGVIAAYQVGY